MKINWLSGHSPSWKGGRRVKASGYVFIYNELHPRLVYGYVREHVLIMEQKLGRYLSDSEVIHHIDGNPGNNDPNNLMLFENQSKHLSYHFTLKNIARCGDPDKYIRKNNKTEYHKLYMRKYRLDKKENNDLI